MFKALSQDLRTRVLAVIAEEPSCRQAALRFGVNAVNDPLAGAGAGAGRCSPPSRSTPTLPAQAKLSLAWPLVSFARRPETTPSLVRRPLTSTPTGSSTRPRPLMARRNGCAHKASACASAFRTAMRRPPPSSPACGLRGPQPFENLRLVGRPGQDSRSISRRPQRLTRVRPTLDESRRTCQANPSQTRSND